MNKSGSIQKFYSIAITVIVIALLVLVVPANAFNLELSSPSNATPEAGDPVSFIATANINAGEQVPLDGFEVTVNGQTCKFNVDGTPISGCDDIQIQILYNDANFQNGNNTFEYDNNTYDYGYGYGYGYGVGHDVKLQYNITIDTTNLSPGTYDVKLKTQIQTDLFKSTQSTFTIKGNDVPTDKDQCKNDGWKDLYTLGGEPFKNQGDCVSYVETYYCDDYEILNSMYNLTFTNKGECVSYYSTEDVIRINAGGNEYTDTNGKVWAKDIYYNTGHASTLYVPIANTEDDYLYKTERYDDRDSPELEYNIPVPNGEYEVTLYFAEVWYRNYENNKRVFDVYLESNLVLDNLDIYKEVGAKTPLKKTFTVNVNDGKVDIDFKHGIENPKISAIEIKKKSTTPITEIRINAGGNEFTDSNSNVWMKDTYYDTGNAATLNVPIANTVDDYLFQTERYDDRSRPELTYNIPVPNGDYEVNLYFAEVWYKTYAENTRVFDVYLESNLVLDNLDIYKEVGANTPLKKTFTVNVNDGKVDIDFKHGIENPKISAIEILSN